jgi:hypothetical protein
MKAEVKSAVYLDPNDPVWTGYNPDYAHHVLTPEGDVLVVRNDEDGPVIFALPGATNKLLAAVEQFLSPDPATGDVGYDESAFDSSAHTAAQLLADYLQDK